MTFHCFTRVDLEFFGGVAVVFVWFLLVLVVLGVLFAVLVSQRS